MSVHHDVGFLASYLHRCTVLEASQLRLTAAGSKQLGLYDVKLWTMVLHDLV